MKKPLEQRPAAEEEMADWKLEVNKVVEQYLNVRVPYYY